MKRAFAKRGQISMFILLGVVFLLTVFVLFYILQIASTQETVLGNKNQDNLNLLAPKQFIESCVENSVLDLLQDTQSVLNQSESTVHLNDSYALLFTQTGGVELLTFQTVANYLDENLKTPLSGCLDTTEYENQGLTVTRGEIKTKTTLSANVISVILDFPLQISGGETSFDISTHRVTIDVPYGKMILAIRETIDAEVQTGWFDQQEFMHRPQNLFHEEPLITIQKYKPYPHTLYKFELSYFDDTLPLTVGIKGVETASLRGQVQSLSFQPLSQYTRCDVDGICSEGVSEATCLVNAGFFQDQKECEENINQNNSKVSFNSCSGIESGNSWCEYHPGVGGRFYRNSCVNGEVQIESCRDFREEVCVEQNDVAVCRPNTAQSCFECTDESCCSQFDCAYISEGLCVPESPLGFNFWDSSQDYCQALYTKIASQSDITSFTSRERGFLCSLLSDCGKTFNYYGDFSQETIDGEKLKDVLTDTGALSYTTTTNPISQFALPESAVTPSKQFAETVTHLQDFLAVSETEFLDPTNELSFSQTISQICQPFYPTQNTCEVCGDNRPCSEYACKSLGTNCQYVLVNGFHQCLSEVPTSDNFAISTIRSTTESISQRSLSEFSGFVFSEPQTVQKPLSVQIQTSENALCKPSYIPGISYGELSSSDLTNGEYATNHTFTIRFINDLPVFGSLASYFGVETGDDLVAEIIDFSFQIEKLQRKYPFIDRFQLPFANALNQFVKVATDLELSATVKTLLEKAAQKNFVVFFSCITENGAELEQQSFIEFGLSHSCSDEIEHLVALDAGAYVNSHVEIITQTFSECRYDIAPNAFDNLTYDFNCPNTLYDVSEAGYVCDADISELLVNRSEVKLYSQCRERVKEPLAFVIDLTLSNEAVFDGNFSNTTNQTNFYQTNVTLVEPITHFTVTEGNSYNTTFLKPVMSDVIFTFDRPSLCSATDVEIGCTDELCFIPKQSLSAVNYSLVKFACETVPESLTCLDTYAQPRHTQLLESQLQKITPYVIDELLITNSSLSFTIFSELTRAVECSYEFEGARAITLTGKTPLDTNWNLFEMFTEEKSGLVRISCVDEFGLRREKSGFVS